MSAAESIFEKAKALLDERQIEALNFANFLIAQVQVQAEASEWSSFSGNQLSRQYCDEDAIHDQA